MRAPSAGSLLMTLLRSWAVESGSSTSLMIFIVTSGKVAMWLISWIADWTMVSVSAEVAVDGTLSGIAALLASV